MTTNHTTPEGGPLPKHRFIRKDLLGVSMIHAYVKGIDLNPSADWQEFVPIEELNAAMDGYPKIAAECKEIHEKKLGEIRAKIEGIKCEDCKTTWTALETLPCPVCSNENYKEASADATQLELNNRILEKEITALTAQLSQVSQERDDLKKAIEVLMLLGHGVYRRAEEALASAAKGDTK